MKKYMFCNNCGKQGHLYHQCKHPITSNGIIAFRRKNSGKTKKPKSAGNKKRGNKSNDRAGKLSGLVKASKKTRKSRKVK